MRNELQEPGQGLLKATASTITNDRGGDHGARIGALNPPAVDEALADDATLAETTPMVAQRGSRRELSGVAADIDRRIIDHAHQGAALIQGGAPSDGGLLRQLSQQLSSLAVQQDQIRRLLEQAEQRSAANRTARS